MTFHIKYVRIYICIHTIPSRYGRVREARKIPGGLSEWSTFEALRGNTSEIWPLVPVLGVWEPRVGIDVCGIDMCQLSRRDSGRIWPIRTMIRQNEIPTAGPVCREEGGRREMRVVKEGWGEGVICGAWNLP